MALTLRRAVARDRFGSNAKNRATVTADDGSGSTSNAVHQSVNSRHSPR
jgi:hypothetical protein